ncbi:DNA-binding transcriptional regulator, MocR family, contains an aminotransferase domain [Filomicrobium insigne]|uniref:DNA-binding transcriptional regulator, MocR family, contains an aminotransferase domain n=1 Tax=Filomicrobium insigne TaxID=418854 RepID=A0A1H0PVV7_9HYPH|nr:PLP-dependent aminotransferase family protein [Filomicrobium insigne]SDP08930.1 DNA-binding transcriptional regulator, MocR family, contains an aminotransferase domain [Filomicrobium insigne]
MLRLELTRGEGRLADQAVSRITEMIQSGSLPTGHKLPSVRGFAEQNDISKSTAVTVYDRLVASGLVSSRSKVGFFVASRTAPLELADASEPCEREVDPLWMMRQALKDDPSMLKPGCGWLPDDWLDGDSIRRSLRKISRSADAQLVGYGQPLGFAPLRHQLQIVLASREIAAVPSQIMLTDSVSQAIDLIVRFLVKPGETVFVDDPGYFNLLNNLRVQRTNIVGIPYTRTGPDLEAFAAAAERERPALYITNSALHNPSGATLSPATAHQLLKLAEQYDIPILEDDIYADFEETPSARLATLDQLDRVIHVGSFSKIMSAACRCGWIACRQDWLEGLRDLKLAIAVTSNELSAQLVHNVLQDGGYRRYVAGVRERLGRTSIVVRRQIEQTGLKLWTEPAGGIFLWAKLPKGVDATEIARQTAREGIALAPGNVFSVSRSASEYLRFNIAQSRNQKIYENLARAIDEYKIPA